MTKFRKIIHLDMDAFFAAVEQRDNPLLRGRPVIVGGPPGTRSVVATCSYEARKFGIHSAMPSTTAAKLCPEAIFINPDIEKYCRVSKDIQAIFKKYTNLVEPVSLDEAYLDVTDVYGPWGSATALARVIKKDVHDKTGLTASAGVSYNKFLAKTASDLDKPDGLAVITPEKAAKFLEKLPIGKFHGIGKKTEARMKEMGILNGSDLLELPLYRLIDLFGKSGEFYYNIVRGRDDRIVQTDWTRKSFGREITMDNDITDLTDIRKILDAQISEICDFLIDNKQKASHLTIKIKYFDFREMSRSVKFPVPTDKFEELSSQCCLLLEKTECGNIPVRLLGSSIQLHDDDNLRQGKRLQEELPF
jgi:DNA polymerase-4